MNITNVGSLLFAIFVSIGLSDLAQNFPVGYFGIRPMAYKEYLSVGSLTGTGLTPTECCTTGSFNNTPV